MSTGRATGTTGDGPAGYVGTDMDRAPAPPSVADRSPDPADSRRARRESSRAASAGGQADEATVDVDVVVVGAGQAGLSAAYHLRRTGLVAVGERGWQAVDGTFVVLDDAPAPGGAWQHRRPGLTMRGAHGVHSLPGMPLLVADPDEPASAAVPYYFAQYEEAFGLHVQRPVAVARVEPDPDDASRLLVRSHVVGSPRDAVTWRARGLVNATGTWRKPFWPSVPGRDRFRGRQLHSSDLREPAELADGHVLVVGGGTSAVELLLALADVTTTTWVTRRPPAWRDDELTQEGGREAVAQMDARTRAGLAPGSVVSVTGLPLTDRTRAGIASGVLRARPMFTTLTPDGARWDEPMPVPAPADGPGAATVPGGAPAVRGGVGGWVTGPPEVRARTVLWCTGFRPAIEHLAPLGLRARGGGILMAGTQVVADPRVQLVGYGPSASTIGANRAGREAALNLRRLLHW